MRIGITFNPKIGEKEMQAVNAFKSMLEEHKIEYFDFHGLTTKTPSLLAVFGGDGTVLSLADYATRNQIPILAVNIGTVGYLTSYEVGDLQDAVNDIVNGNFKISERSVLRVTTSTGEDFIALNDAVVERGRFTHDVAVVSKLKLKIDGNEVYDTYGDGLIIATPTGSTAYSLSSGGVILTPDLNSFIATPVCPHRLNARPIVYRDDKTVEIEILPTSCSCVLCIDGRCVKTLSLNEKVVVAKNEKSLKIIDSCENFYKKLIKKIG